MFLTFAYGALLAPQITIVIFQLFLVVHLLSYLIFKLRSEPINSPRFELFVPEPLRNIDIRVLSGAYRERSVGHHGFVFAHPENALHKKDANSFEHARASMIHEIVHAKFHDYSTLIFLIISALVALIVFFQFAGMFLSFSFSGGVNTDPNELPPIVQSQGFIAAARMLFMASLVLLLTTLAILFIIRNTLHDREYRADYFTSKIVDLETYIALLRSKINANNGSLFQPSLQKRLELIQKNAEGLNLFRDGILIGVLIMGGILGMVIVAVFYSQIDISANNTLLAKTVGQSINPFQVAMLVPVILIIALQFKFRRLRSPLKKMLKFNIGFSTGLFLMSFVLLTAYSSDKSIYVGTLVEELMISRWFLGTAMLVAVVAFWSLCFASFTAIVCTVISLVILYVLRAPPATMRIDQLLATQGYFTVPIPFLVGAFLQVFILRFVTL